MAAFDNDDDDDETRLTLIFRMHVCTYVYIPMFTYVDSERRPCSCLYVQLIMSFVYLTTRET